MPNTSDFLDAIPEDVLEFMQHCDDDSALRNNVMLVGGAPRDWLLGGNVSDYDFFVNAANISVNRFDACVGFFTCRGWFVKPSPAYGSLRVETVTKNGDKVQLVHTLDGISDIDISTCQVGVTPLGAIRTTEAFERSCRCRYHIVYLDNNVHDDVLRQSLFDHLPRVIAKYPWPVEVAYRKYKGVSTSVTDKARIPF